MSQHFIEDELIILSKETIESFLRHKKVEDLTTLYIFYYYTAKWQKTNQPKCTIGYTAKGLQWGEDRVRNAKRVLVKLGLVEDIKEVDKRTGRIIGWFVKVNYIWRQEVVSTLRDFHPLVNKEGNALNVSNKTIPKGIVSDSSSHPNGSFIPNRKEVELMEYWNRLKNVPKHVKQDTKVYKNSCKMIRRLKSGTFSKHYVLDKDYKERNSIKDRYLRDKWEDDDIKEAMYNTSLLYMEGYWPHDKKKLPKGLPDLMFNQFSNKSFFLLAMFNPPKLENNKVHSKPIDKDLYKKYREVYLEHIRYPKDEEKLIICINDIYAFLKKKFKTAFGDSSKYWKGVYKTPIPLMEDHVRWLRRKDKVFFSYLETDSTMFTNYLIYLSNQHHSWNFIDKEAL